jgi:pimeloyl-ACP methyl ester carboxylesterase
MAATTPSGQAPVHDRVCLEVGSVEVDASVLHRPGPGRPLVFLHGFGSTKEDYADVVRDPAFDGHEVLAWDAPGFGASDCSDFGAVDIPFLVATGEALLDHFGIRRFHLVGHSMGGLTALLLADRSPEKVLSFANIEGNLASEDCFLSRQIHTHADVDPARFLSGFCERAWMSSAWASALYAVAVQRNVQAAVVRSIFESMVTLSDRGRLLERFLALPCPRLFMYGDQNRHLSYLPTLRGGGVELAEIERCGHFPMYSNPPQAWASLAGLVVRASATSGCDDRP